MNPELGKCRYLLGAFLLLALPAAGQTVAGTQLEIGPAGANQVQSSQPGGAVGSENVVLGNWSMGVGSQNTIYGSASTALGDWNYNNADLSLAVGHYNFLENSSEEGSAYACLATGSGNRINYMTAYAFVAGLENQIGSVGLDPAYGASALGVGLFNVWSGSTLVGVFNGGAGSLTNVIFAAGNGESDEVRSNAIVTLLSGQTTLTNKAWKANPGAPLADPAPANDNQGNALVVEGHVRMEGKVIIARPQGDIGMGEFGGP